MAMNVGNESGDSEVMVEMNTTPLIDVMLVLLVMLIITLPIQTHAVKLDMPPPNPHQPPVPPQVIDVNVDFDGTVEWNHNPTTMAALDSYFYQQGTTDPQDQAEIHISVDRLAKYDIVAKVLANAQRRGVTKIGIVNTNQYIQ
jgi:biopolymer transport protein ExbD